MCQSEVSEIQSPSAAEDSSKTIESTKESCCPDVIEICKPDKSLVNSEDTLHADKSKELKLDATCRPADKFQPVTYRVSDTQVAEVTPKQAPSGQHGLVLKPKKAGDIKLEALCSDHVLATWSISFRNRKIVVIDPGHGDIFDKYLDPGAVAKNAKGEIIAKEKDLALAVSEHILANLTARPEIESAFLTRAGDLDDKTRTQLAWRTDFAKEKGADILVSIHLDAAGATATGHSVFYYDSEAGKNLATQIDSAYIKIKSRASAKSKNLYVCREFSGAAALVELGFITNESDRNSISGEQAQIGKEIADGIVAYIKSL